jgi:hypothetical protein
MKKILCAPSLALALVACGGGGDSGQIDAISAKSTAARKALEPALVAQPVSVVNTTTAGDQSLRSIGAVTDGGYTVAWMSGDALYMQHYDSAGNRIGGETLVQLRIGAGDTASFIATNSSVAVLADGGVVVVYSVVRDKSLDPTGPVLTETGIYMQRFGANGVQVLAETQLASRVQVVHSRSSFFGQPKALALADGGYVIGWADFTPSAVAGIRTTFYNQRFDSQNQAAGDTVVIGQPGAVGASYSFTADAHGGYTVSSFQIDPNNYPRDLVTVTHYDANQTATQIVAPRLGGAVLLPLGDGTYVLFAVDSSGNAYRQMLDSAGNRLGDPTPVSSMPVSARELADGSYVLFWAAGGDMTAQRFDSSGAPMGDVLAIETNAGAARLAALADGGFAAAWSTASTAGDLDVYTQLFVEMAGSKRKACLDSAKGMKGRDRKAFMNACMQ